MTAGEQVLDLAIRVRTADGETLFLDSKKSESYDGVQVSTISYGRQ